MSRAFLELADEQRLNETKFPSETTCLAPQLRYIYNSSIGMVLILWGIWGVGVVYAGYVLTSTNFRWYYSINSMARNNYYSYSGPLLNYGRFENDTQATLDTTQNTTTRRTLSATTSKGTKSNNA